jgi:hypothetical protein
MQEPAYTAWIIWIAECERCENRWRFDGEVKLADESV